MCVCVCVCVCVWPGQNYYDAVTKLEAARIEWELRMTELCKVLSHISLHISDKISKFKSLHLKTLYPFLISLWVADKQLTSLAVACYGGESNVTTESSITTNQPHTKYNPNPNTNPTVKQHASVNIQLNIVACQCHYPVVLWLCVLVDFCSGLRCDLSRYSSFCSYYL